MNAYADVVRHGENGNARGWQQVFVFAVPVGLAIACGKQFELSGWAQMTATAVVIFDALKWLTWNAAVDVSLQAPSVSLTAGYFVGWVGLNAKKFLFSRASAADVGQTGWRGVAAAICGAILIFVGVRWTAPVRPFAAGWIGQIGFVLFLHFGLFHLLAVAWQRAGVSAAPIMLAPLSARSVGDFWQRWNQAFRDAAYTLVYRPSLHSFGPPVATLAVFVASGLIHELVISVPAGGGYGGPTLYFVIQYVGLIFERSALGKRVGLRHGWRGRAFVLLCVAGPLPLLAPAVFVYRVTLPLLTAVGAL